MPTMPVFTSQAIDHLRATLTTSEYAIFERIVATQGKNKGALRAAKPKVDKADPASGYAAYVWRMVAFQVSPISAHHCIPFCADFDVPHDPNTPTYNGYDMDSLAYKAYWQAKEPFIIARKNLIKELDKLADKVVNTIPKNQWYGIARWGKAMGY